MTRTSTESLDNCDRAVNWADETDVEVSHNGAVAITSSRKKQSQGLMVVNGSLWLTAKAIDAVPQNSAVVYPDYTRFSILAPTFSINLSLAYRSKLSPTL